MSLLRSKVRRWEMDCSWSRAEEECRQDSRDFLPAELPHGTPLTEEPLVRQRLAPLPIEVDVAWCLSYRVATSLSAVWAYPREARGEPMDLSLNEEQQLLQDSARDFLRQECPTTHVRAMEEDATGYSPELWQQIIALGWAGLMFPEQYGGSGYTFVELCVFMEECGRTLLPSPFHSTVVAQAIGL